MPYHRHAGPCCCLFCRSENYHPRIWANGIEWHLCPQANRARQDVKNIKNRNYYRQVQGEKGLEVKDRVKSVRAIKVSERLARACRKGVYIKARYNACVTCGLPTVNRWRCGTCLSTLVFDDAWIEVGESRRLGVRGH